MNSEKIIENIAKKSGLSTSKLNDELSSILEGIPPGDNREEKALRELNKQFSNKSSAMPYEGIIFGLGQLGDYTGKMIAEALDRYNQDSIGALQAGIVKEVDGKIVVIDNRETFKSGKKNFNFGKVLNHSYNRTCLALILVEGRYTVTKLELRDKFATENLPPMNVLVSFKANGNVTDGLRTAASTKWETTRVVPTDELGSLLIEKCPDHLKQLGDCFEYHRGLKEGTTEYYDRYIITNGTVSYAKEAGEGKNSAYMVIDDITVDSTVSCFVPSNITLPDVDTDVTIIAKTSIGKRWDSENKISTDEDVLQLNVMGLVPQA